MGVDVLDRLLAAVLVGVVDGELHAALAAEAAGGDHVVAVGVGAVSDELGVDLGPPGLGVLELFQDDDAAAAGDDEAVAVLVERAGGVEGIVIAGGGEGAHAVEHGGEAPVLGLSGAAEGDVGLAELDLLEAGADAVGAGGAGGGAIWCKVAQLVGGAAGLGNINLKLVHATLYNNLHASPVKNGLRFSGTAGVTTNFSAYNSIIVTADDVSLKAVNFTNANLTNMVNCILGGLEGAATANSIVDDATKNNLKGKNATYNSMKIIEIYKGKSNEFSQAVALNVAAGLIVSGKENDFKDAFKKATKHLKSGNVFQYLSKIQSA